jgi:hypothetical protein
MRIAGLTINENDIDDALRFCASGGILSVIGSAILNSIKGFIIPLLVDPLIGTLQEQIESQLCQQANPDLNPPCPTGTQDVDGVCRYGPTSDDECASIVLGMDGNIDLGGFLASFSPGTTGGFDFLFAAGGHNVRDDGSGFHWGDLNPIGQGVTLGMYGGAEATPLSGCVTPAAVQLPTGIPIPDELVANTVADWPMGMAGPHSASAFSTTRSRSSTTRARCASASPPARSGTRCRSPRRSSASASALRR